MNEQRPFEPEPEQGDRSDRAAAAQPVGDDRGAESTGFASTSPVSFEAAEQNLMFTLVGAVQSTRRTAAMLAAAEATAYTELVVIAQKQSERRMRVRKDAELPMRELITEVSAALRVSDRVAQRLISDAVTLTAAFPSTHAALAEGRISPSHARVIVDAGVAIGDTDARADYEAKAVRVAEVESSGRLRPIAQILAARAHPETIDDRHRRVRRHRDVRVIDADDGMAELRAYLPAALAYGIHDRLSQMAKSVRADETSAAKAAESGDGILSGLDDLLAHPPQSVTPLEPAAAASLADPGRGSTGHSAGDDEPMTGDAAPDPDVQTDPARSMDELRADLLADLLLSGAPTGHGDGLDAIKGYVQVTVPVLTLADESSEPAVLAGHGPIDAATARRLAGAATGWDRVMTDPVTGDVLAVDRYRPSAHLRRFLRVRDQHCRFPNCRVPAWRGDADHTLDAALGGLTCDDNLACLCEPHHIGKHRSRWRVVQLEGGKLEWTSPTGRTYVDTPERTLLFTADGDPPPF